MSKWHHEQKKKLGQAEAADAVAVRPAAHGVAGQLLHPL